jgi:hypothetical protein
MWTLWMVLPGSEFGQVGMLAIALLALGPLVIGPLLRGRRARQRAGIAADAQLRGMAYQAPAGDGTAGSLDEGTHLYSGTTGDISWTVETLVMAQSEAEGSGASTRIAAGSYSRWSSSVEAGQPGYLLLMNLPEPPPAEGGTGPFQWLADRTASLALQFYARAHFGGARAGSLPLSPGHRQSSGHPELDRLYAVFSDTPARLARLNPATRAWLKEHHGQRLAVLWDGAGLALGGPCPRMTPQEVNRLAGLAVDLAQLRLPGARD